MTVVLLTGFEPFDGQRVNASWAAVEQVALDWTGPAELVTRRLPVSFARSATMLRTLVAEVDPDLVVCVGEAGGRGTVSLERVALNVQDARIPDEDGASPVDEPVVAGGPVAHLSSLPLKACLVAVRAEGVPVEVSNTAGTYVCNSVAYVLAELIEQGRRQGGTEPPRGGFVHVPRTPGQVAVGEPSLDAGSAARALAAVLRTALSTSVDLPVQAGTLA
ncbi:pyroglutamyl-peptidase I [Cellulomonas hominis]